MAEEFITLNPPKYFWDNPIVQGNGEAYTGANTISVRADWLDADLQIPNIFQLLDLRVALTTSAVVANRNIKINYAPAVNQIGMKLQGANVAASTTDYMSLSPGKIESTGASSWNSYAVFRQPIKIVGWSYPVFHVSIENPQAGDVFSVYSVWEYLNFQMGITLEKYREWERDRLKWYRPY